MADIFWWSLTDVGPGQTGAVGLSFDFVAGIGGTVGVGLVLLDGDGNVGLLAPQGGFLASTGVAGGLSAWAQGTYASTIYDQVGGWDMVIGGSAAFIEGGGANLVLASPAMGSVDPGIELSYEFLAIDASPFTGAEFHAGAIFTGQPKWTFNVYDSIGIPRPSQRGLCCN